MKLYLCKNFLVKIVWMCSYFRKGDTFVRAMLREITNGQRVPIVWCLQSVVASCSRDVGADTTA